MTTTRYGLSQIINQLLGTTEPQPFDFLIAGTLLRESLESHLAAHNVSTVRGCLASVHALVLCQGLSCLCSGKRPRGGVLAARPAFCRHSARTAQRLVRCSTLGAVCTRWPPRILGVSNMQDICNCRNAPGDNFMWWLRRHCPTVDR